jgi:hypothetical protein
MKTQKMFYKDWIFINKFGFAILIISGAMSVVFKMMGIAQRISIYDNILMWASIGLAMIPLIDRLMKRNKGLFSWKSLDLLWIMMAGIVYFSLYILPRFVLWLIFPWADDLINPTIEVYLTLFGFMYCFYLMMVGLKIAADNYHK